MSLHKLFNEISELVYISDIETYDLLFLNSVGKDLFGVEDIAGKKCHEILWGSDVPCGYCPNAHLGRESFSSCEVVEPTTGKHVIFKDKITDWEGVPAHIGLAADVTERDRQTKELQSALEVETVLLDCVRKLYESDKSEDAIDYMLRRIAEFLKADRSYIFQFEDNLMRNTYEWCAEGVEPQITVRKEAELRAIESWLPFFDQKKYVVIDDIGTLAEETPQELGVLRSNDMRNLIVSPLELHGELLGFIGIDNPAEERPGVSLLLDSLGYFFLSSVERKRVNDMLRKLSFFDMLTGLHNRNQFIRDIEELSQGVAGHIGIIYLDINGLKDVNDRFGHMRGDDVLAKAATIIKTIFDESCVYRIGGDEFVILCRDIPKSDFLRNLTELKNLFLLSKECQAAIGHAWAESVSDINELISSADGMMYTDKKRFYRANPSAVRYRYTNDDMLDLSDPEFLDQAIRQQRFLVYLQPKISFEDRGVIGAEALVRYRDDSGSIISPNEFIPLLEDSKLISRIDLYVFDVVCQRIKKWISEGHDVVPISVNFSRYTLLERDFIEQLLRIWEKYDIPQSLIEVEITESVDDVDRNYMLEIIDQLKEASFSVSIDDFGVRYANLVLFTNASIDTLKLDKSLLDDLTANKKSRLLIRSLVQICSNMNIRIIVEGVETEEQFDILRELQCDGAQGFLFSRPLPLLEYESKYLFGEPAIA